MESAKKLLDKTSTLRMIHKSSAALEHAILQSGYRWEPYVPTHFIYAYFAYNSLYNIDWARSLMIRRPFTHDYRVTEHQKRTAYIDFCCKDSEFMDIYKSFFIRYVTARHSAKEIIKELEKINPDRPHSNGNITEEIITSFIEACNNCLIRDNFDKEVVTAIEKFIYKIRCNLFHGIKKFDELNEPLQQIRLDIYSAFVVALNQMIFSYLEYLIGEDITLDFEYLLDRLKWEQSY